MLAERGEGEETRIEEGGEVGGWKWVCVGESDGGKGDEC